MVVAFMNSKLLWLSEQICNKINQKDSNMGQGWVHNVLPLARELLAVSGYRIRDNHSPVDNYTPLCIWVVLIGLSVI